MTRTNDHCSKNKSVLISVNQCLNLYLYLKKQTQFFPVFSPKTLFRQIQSQFKANLNPIQTQFPPLNMNNLVYPVIFSKNTVLICVNQCLNIIRVTCPERPVVSKVEPCRRNSWNLLLKTIPFYAKRTQTSTFSAQKPRFHQKTKPKQTQNKAKLQNTRNELIPSIDKTL